MLLFLYPTKAEEYATDVLLLPHSTLHGPYRKNCLEFNSILSRWAKPAEPSSQIVAVAALGCRTRGCHPQRQSRAVLPENVMERTWALDQTTQLNSLAKCPQTNDLRFTCFSNIQQALRNYLANSHCSMIACSLWFSFQVTTKPSYPYHQLAPVDSSWTFCPNCIWPFACSDR